MSGNQSLIVTGAGDVVTGFTFTGTNANGGNGVILLDGQNIRYHHNHQISSAGVAVTEVLNTHLHTILVDHNVIDSNGGSAHQFEVKGDFAFAGNGSWQTPLALGGNLGFFVEDNTFNNSGQTDDCIDGYAGGRIVARHNQFTASSASFGGSIVGFHGTDSGFTRSFFSAEVYQNTFTNNTSATMRAFTSRGGTALIWGNTYNGSHGSWNGPFLQNNRGNGSGNVSAWGNADGTNWLLQNYPCGQSTPFNCTNVTSGGWHWCNVNRDTPAQSDSTCAALTPGDTATAFFDNNPGGSGPAGYAPRDNIGRTHNQVLAPFYEWLNTGYSGIGHDAGNFIQANQDFYQYTASFTGATGTGSGTLAARPATCTPRVAYWATDTSTLYQCLTANNWTTYYTPLAYPHPLQSASTRPQPSTGLAAVVH